MYILAGGSDLKYPEYGKRLGLFIENEIANPTILSCMFAVAADEREAKHAVFDNWFYDNFTTNHQVVHADETHFIKQMQQADVIYIHGGSTGLLLRVMESYSSIHHYFGDKIVIGSSAGANFLSSVGYSPKQNELMHGAGVVDASVVVHYGVKEFHGNHYDTSDWHAVAQLVGDESGRQNVTLLPEGEFTVFYNNENH